MAIRVFRKFRELLDVVWNNSPAEKMLPSYDAGTSKVALRTRADAGVASIDDGGNVVSVAGFYAAAGGLGYQFDSGDWRMYLDDGLLNFGSGGLVRFTSAGGIFCGPVSSTGASTAGSLTIRDQTATTGVTKLTLRLGAGNEADLFGGNVLEVQRADGTPTVTIRNDGLIRTAYYYTLNGKAGLTDIGGDSNRVMGLNLSTYTFCGIAWGGSDSDWYGVKDLGIFRASPGNLEITDGINTAFGAGYGNAKLKNLTATETVAGGAFTVAGLPAAGTAGRVAFATNGRKNGEGGGAGTGVLVFDDGTAWRACDTGATVAA